jgi:hypothetical protein
MPVSPLYLFIADNIPLLPDLECGKINCEQHDLSDIVRETRDNNI